MVYGNLACDFSKKGISSVQLSKDIGVTQKNSLVHAGTYP